MHDAPSTLEDSSARTSSGSDASRKEHNRSRSWYKILGSTGLSLAVLLGIGYFTFDAQAFWQILGEMRPWPIGVAVLLTGSRIFFGGWRLRFISHGRLNLREGMRGQLAWEFFSNVTPSAIGGGPITALYIARDRGIDVGEVTAFVLFSILLDQFWFVLSIPLVLVASFYVEVIPSSVGSVGLWTFVAIFLGMLTWSLLFAYATLFRPSLLERLAHRIFSFRYLNRFHERVMEEMHTFTQRAESLRAQSPAFYAKGVLLTAGAWMGRYLLIAFIVWSVFPGFDKLLVILRTIALMLSALILPTPGGSGGLEGLYALFIGPLLPDALVAPTLLAWRTLGYYVYIALGAYLFIHEMQQHTQPDAPEKAADRSATSPATPPQPETEAAE